MREGSTKFVELHTRRGDWDSSDCGYVLKSPVDKAERLQSNCCGGYWHSSGVTGAHVDKAERLQSNCCEGYWHAPEVTGAHVDNADRLLSSCREGYWHSSGVTAEKLETDTSEVLYAERSFVLISDGALDELSLVAPSGGRVPAAGATSVRPVCAADAARASSWSRRLRSFSPSE